MPWSKLWKEPIEIIVEDIHAVCSVKGNFNQQFAEELFMHRKESAIKKILKEIQQNTDRNEKTSESFGFLSGMLTAISENIRFKLSGVHLRFEDID